MALIPPAEHRHGDGRTGVAANSDRPNEQRVLTDGFDRVVGWRKCGSVFLVLQRNPVVFSWVVASLDRDRRSVPRSVNLDGLIGIMRKTDRLADIIHADGFVC